MSSKTTKNLIFAAFFAALTAVFTAFVKIYIPGAGGYVHLGDTLIYICASLIPLPYSICAAAIGGLFADILAGAPIWAPATLIIKALLVLTFTYKKDRIICGRNIVASAVGLVITTAGYYLAEIILLTASNDYPNAAAAFTGALVSVPWNILQAAASGILFIIAGLALDKTKIKTRLIK